ncbi:MAG: DNA-deoxyinosine glycosylase [Pseudomonadota bacterium]|nr:DNA-deoxyinosine glycosylase [Pseudomonadota bacterium]
MLKSSMPPIARPDATLFILGSLPGDASLAAQRYYAHPTNQFWRLLGSAIGQQLDALPYEQRLERLAERRIGLWDVVATATRPGSLDQAIRNAGHNPIDRLREGFPQLRAVAFNGTAAASAGRRLFGVAGNVALLDLPSSSAANTRQFTEKAEAWAVLAQYCAPKGLPNAPTAPD